jgi:glycerol-3-phosphate acyltransferase PlsX
MKMTDTLTIALDVMGGDHGPKVVIPAASLALSQRSDLCFLLFGRAQDITPLLDAYPDVKAVSTLNHTDDVVSSAEKPSIALRQGRKSSMRLSIESVSNGQASCVVSGGNTGALMAMAKVVLKTLPGIHRPAIASVFPTVRGHTVVLDLGANLACDPEMMVQFAVLGAVYARTVRGIENPTVGLLNVGSEEMKGHDELRDAASILSTIKFPGVFKGFIEGNDIPMGTTDVVVTDGFTGNVALKVTEGVSKLMGIFLKDAFRSSFWSVLGYWFSAGAMGRLKKRLDPRLYNGGMFLGLNGVCVKSHGGTDDVGFANAILVAADLVHNKFNDKVAAEIDHVMNQESFLTSVTAEVS